MRKMIALLGVLILCIIVVTVSGEENTSTNLGQLSYYVNALLPISPGAELEALPDTQAGRESIVTSLRIMDSDLRAIILGYKITDSMVDGYRIEIILLDESLPIVDANTNPFLSMMCPGFDLTNPNLTVCQEEFYQFYHATSEGKPDDTLCLLFLAKSKEIFQDDSLYQICLTFDKNHYLRMIKMIRLQTRI